MAKKIAASRLSRLYLTSLVPVILVAATVSRAFGQDRSAAAPERDTGKYWRNFSLGFASSLIAHESAHFFTAFLVGAHPHVGFDKGRPTIYSGIDSQSDPHKQFLFSASGLTTQDVLNELILDIPHLRGSSLERGILAGGIATTLFYITIGRNGAVSDVAFMSRTSSLSKNQLSLIFGGVSAVQAWRISRDPRYRHFFLRPAEAGIAAGFSY